MNESNQPTVFDLWKTLGELVDYGYGQMPVYATTKEAVAGDSPDYIALDQHI